MRKCRMWICKALCYFVMSPRSIVNFLSIFKIEKTSPILIFKKLFQILLYSLFCNCVCHRQCRSECAIFIGGLAWIFSPHYKDVVLHFSFILSSMFKGFSCAKRISSTAINSHAVCTTSSKFAKSLPA